MDPREKLAALIANMGGMLEILNTENRDFTDEETTKYDEMKAEAESIRNRIKRQDEFDSHNEIQPRVTTDAQPTAPAQTGIQVIRHRYGGKLKAFAPKQGETHKEAEKKAYDTGRFLMATFGKDQKSMQYCIENGIIKNAQEGGVLTKGGALVPDQMEQAIIDLREEYGVFRRNCRDQPMSTDTVTRPRKTGRPTVYYPDEGGLITESESSWDNVKLTARKAALLTRISSELNEDSIISVADDLTMDFGWGLANAEDEAGFNGDGTSTYGGMYGLRPKIINGSHGAGAVDVKTATHDKFIEIDASDIAFMMASVPAFALPGSKFYCSQAFYGAVFERLTQAAGGNTISDMSAGMSPRYMGYNIEISQVWPAGLDTSYDAVAMLGFGNLAMSASLGDRRGITIAASEHRYFDTDQIAVKGTQRYDINVHELGDGTTAGPMVCLIGSIS